MNKYKLLENVGFGILVIGFIAMIVEALIAPDSFSFFTENNEIFFWGGMGMWAIGYGYRQQQEKEKETKDKQN